VPGGKAGDQLAHLGGLRPYGPGELAALGIGFGAGFGGTERRVVLSGMATAEFGVGDGDGEVALGAGGGVPVFAVGHGGGEDSLALPVGVVQGPVATGRPFFSGPGRARSGS
jgi:hypothetical protein